MTWTEKMILEFRRARSGAWRLPRRGVLDVWAGDTVDILGHRAFRDPDGQRTRLVMPDGSLRLVPQGAGAQGWEELIDTITADGVQISNTLTETIICPDFNIPAYYMAPGRTLRLWAFGVTSNVITTPGTLTLRVRWGGAVSGVVLLASAAQGLDTTARTNALWLMEASIVCRTAGSSGLFMSGGIMMNINLLSTTASNLLPALLGSAGTPLASGNVAVTVDTTIAKLLSVTAQFSVTTNPTNFTCQQRILEVLN